MMPVIRISDATYARLQKYAKPFEDSPDSIIAKALSALDMMSVDTDPVVVSVPSKRIEGRKLPQKEFRIPLLVTLLDLGGTAPAKAVREKMEPLMAPRLNEGDYESVSTGDPRWWNAVCWERSDLVKEGLMRENSPRGTWEISDEAKALPASYHRSENGTDRMVEKGSLEDMARRYREASSFAQDNYFIMVGDTTFQREAAFSPLLFKPVGEFELSVRTENCLKNDNIVYVGDLVQKTEEEMLRTPNFGRRSLNEITEVLKPLGLHLGMTIKNWPPEDTEALAAAYQKEVLTK